MDSVIKIIDEVAEKCLEELLKNKELSGGVNGPYHDPETGIRVSAHWIFLFAYEYDKTSDVRFHNAIHILADYIYNNQLDNGTFICRNKKGKDCINGTIGIAWAIEGLIEATKVLNNEDYYSAAVKAFHSQKFDNKTGLWIRQEVDGKFLGYDNTYNHQLWFAAAGAQICSYRREERIEQEVCSFLDHSKTTFRVFKSGLVHHFAIVDKSIKTRVKSEIKFYKQVLLRLSKRASYQYKEEGYHNFNIYAFALLHKVYPEHPFFESDKLKRALEYSFDLSNSIALQDNHVQTDSTGLAVKYTSKCNIYGFSYNSPAFELPFIFKEFLDTAERTACDQLLCMQIQLTYDDDKKSFCRNTEDSITLDARTYEYIRTFL